MKTAAKKLKLTSNTTTKGKKIYHDRFHTVRVWKARRIIETMNLEELFSLTCYLEEGGEVRPVRDAIAKLPEDIHERIFQLVEHLQDVAYGADSTREEIQIAITRLTVALVGENLAEGRKSKHKQLIEKLNAEAEIS